MSIIRSFRGIYKVVKDGGRFGRNGILKKRCGQSRMASYAIQSISY
jgi:hypothetical protein